MKKVMKVAVIQTRVPSSHFDAEKNLDRLLKKATKRPVDIVGLPEDCLANYEEVKVGYDPLNFISCLAAKHKVYIFGANISKEQNGKYYNTGFLFDKKGKLILKHHKVALTPFSKLTSGNTLNVVDTDLGRLSMLICRDSMNKYSAWFFDKLRKANVELILIPSLSIDVSRSKIDISLWVDSLKALYNWFFMPIAASGTIGKNFTPHPSFGHALIIGNGGEMVVGSRDEEEILYLNIDREKLKNVRQTIETKWAEKKIPKTKLNFNKLL